MADWGTAFHALAEGLRNIDASRVENQRYKNEMARQALLDVLTAKRVDIDERRMMKASQPPEETPEMQNYKFFRNLPPEEQSGTYKIYKNIDDNPPVAKEPTGFSAEAALRQRLMSPENFNVWLTGGIKERKTPKLPPNIIGEINRKLGTTTNSRTKEEIYNQDYKAFLPNLEASYPGSFTNASDSIPRELGIGQYAPPPEPNLWQKIFGGGQNTQATPQSDMPPDWDGSEAEWQDYKRLKGL